MPQFRRRVSTRALNGSRRIRLREMKPAMSPATLDLRALKGSIIPEEDSRSKRERLEPDTVKHSSAFKNVTMAFLGLLV